MDRSMVGETMFIYSDPNRSWGGSQISAGPGAAAAAALGLGQHSRGAAPNSAGAAGTAGTCPPCFTPLYLLPHCPRTCRRQARIPDAERTPVRVLYSTPQARGRRRQSSQPSGRRRRSAGRPAPTPAPLSAAGKGTTGGPRRCGPLTRTACRTWRPRRGRRCRKARRRGATVQRGRPSHRSVASRR